VTAAPSPRETLERLLHAALAAVDPSRVIRAAVSRHGGVLSISGAPVPSGVRLRVLAAGKAAPGMAAALEEIAGDRIAGGLVVTKDGHGRPLAALALREAGHPVPDARSEEAGRALLACARDGDRGEVIVVLLSGGASALLACPLPGLTREAVARTTTLLLASGAAIDELNCVRKHLCDVTGGRLARAVGGRAIHLLAISDVIGDRLDVIGSGPCTADPTTYADALGVLRARGLAEAVPAAVRGHLEAGMRGERPESPKAGEACFSAVRATVVASNRDALRAAREAAEAAGLRFVTLAGALQGEAREAGRRLAALARAARPRAPTLVAAGGETTVALRGTGRGGRNQELALAAAVGLAGLPGATLLAAGTDGTDGPTDAAGAIADGGTVARGAACGASAAEALAGNDSHSFFLREGGLLRTGPTGTNVMDLAFLLLLPTPA
jgi:glycerate-2-kinase